MVGDLLTKNECLHPFTNSRFFMLVSFKIKVINFILIKTEMSKKKEQHQLLNKNK